MEKNSIEAKKYARQCIKIKKTYGGAYYELGSAELNLCNKSFLLKIVKYVSNFNSGLKKYLMDLHVLLLFCF